MNRSSIRKSRFALFLCLFFALPAVLSAAAIDFQVLLDVDNNAATGCSVSGMSGVDQVITTAVTTTESTGSVTSMSRRVCSGGALGAPTDIDTTGWGIGFNPASGQMVVESRVSYAALGGGPFSMRVGFVATTGTTTSSVFTRADSQPILFPEPAHGRRRSATPGNLDERIFTLDGLTGDWGMIPPLGSANAAGQPAFRLSQVYGYGDGEHFWFRADANLSKNPPPQANDDAYSVRQGQIRVVPAPGILTNDTSPSGLPLSASVVTNPTHGVLTLNSNGGFTYVHDGSFTSSDFFEYRASDGLQDSNTAKVIITIQPNGVPQAAPDAYATTHRGVVTVPAPGVLANDNDPDGDPLTAVGLSNPANGTLVFNPNGAFTYTHNGTNTLTDSFTYAATDGLSQSNTTQVSITIAADVPPTAGNDAYGVNEGATLNVAAPGLFANDTDPDTPISLWNAQVVTAPVNGTLTMGAGGAFTYVHNGSETTSDSFVYRVNDGIANSNNATVTITITPVNDPPVAGNDAYNTNEDTPLTVPAPGVLTNDTDPEGQAMTAAIVANGTNGNAVVNANGGFTYTPNANFNGTDTFTYTATDASLAVSNTATVTITVAAVNDAPTFTAGANVAVNEDSGAYSAPWATAISSGPADESAQTVSFNISNDNNALFSGQPTLSPAGVLTFTPAANANGSATVTVSLTDTGSGTAPNVNTSASVNFTITVNAINDAPSFTVPAAAPAVNEGSGPQITVNGFATAISAGPANEAGQTLTFQTSNDNNPMFSMMPAISPAGDLTYEIASPDTFGTATVTVTLADNGSGTPPNVNMSATQQFTITVNPVNDAPVNSMPAAQNMNEDVPLVLSLANGNYMSVSDVDAASAPFRATLTATNGTLTAASGSGSTLTGNGTATLIIDGTIAQVNAALNGLTFTPTANYSGAASIQFLSSDLGATGSGGTLTDTETLNITIAAVNDAPTFTSGGNVTVAEDSGAYNSGWATGITPGGGVDEAGQALTFNAGNDNNALFTLGGQPAIAPNGTLTFTPAADASGVATVTVTLSDNGSGTAPNVNTSAPVQFTITISAVNDAPVVTTTGGTTAFIEDAGAVAVDGGLTIADVDSLTLASATVTITNLLDAGVEVLSAPTLLGGVTANYAAPTLTLTGTASLADYQTMLRAVTYINNSNNPNTTNRVIAFQVNDGAGVNNLSNVANKTVSVAATNDAPVVTTSVGPTAFTEDGGAVTVDSGVTVADVDNTTIASATVTITNLLDAGLEVLSAPTLLGGATANYVAPTLTISGTTSVANYQAMLAAVTYNNSSQTPNTTVRVIAFVANDGTTNSAAANKSVSITEVNDAPVVTTTGGTTAFIEDAGAVAVDGGITVTDIDSATLSTAVVTITNIQDAGLEVLAAPTLLGGVNAVYSAPNLTIIGTATVAEYQTMLRAVTYINNSNNPNTTNRVVNFTVDDGGSINNISNTAAKTVSVAGANDAPVVTASGGTTAFTEDGGAVVVDNAVTVTDVDNTNIASATVTITNLLDAGVEVLAAPTLLGGVTANYVAPTLTLTGSASLADYETMLRAVTYNNTSQNPNTTNRVIAFAANDGTTNSAASNKTVSVAAVNDAPVVTTSGGTTAFVENGGAVAVDGALTVTDIDSANIASATVTISNLLDAGQEFLTAGTVVGGVSALYVAPTLTFTGSATVAEYETMLRAVTYGNGSNTPNTTNRVINFQVNDGAGVNNVSNIGSKTVSVAATNDAPVVTTTAGTVTFTEAGGAIVVDSGVTVTDVDSPNIASATVTITNLLDAGMETLAAPTLLGGVTANYVAPTLTLSGSASLADYETMLRAVTYNNASTSPNTTNRTIGFQVNDGAGVNNLSNTATRDVVIVSVNSQPVVTTSGGTTAFVEDGAAVAIDGGLTVSDPDNTTLASATVTITNLLDAGLETLNAPSLLGGATANYVAPTLTISGTTTLANYETMLRAVTYHNASDTPNTTNRVIGFQINDGQGANNLSAVANKTVSVAPSNDAPVVTTSGGTTAFTEGAGAVAVDTGVTVSDVDSATIASATVTISNLLDAGMETLAAPTLLGGATANYVAPTLTISGATTIANYQTMLAAVTYNNASNNPNVTNRTINFQVNDGAANSNIAAKTVSVTGANSAPVVTTSGGTTAFVEDGAAVAIDGGLTVSDPDNTTLASATVTITNLLDAGLETLNAPSLLGGATANYVAPTLTISGTTTLANYETMLRAVTYHNASNTPNTTNRVIGFQINDGQGANNLSAVANKTVSVAVNNDAPVVATSAGTTAFTEGAGAVAVDTGVTVSDVDSAMIASATVTISNLLDAGMETLAAPTLLGGATANYVAPTLTISGATTIANYQTMLAAVTYNNASNNPNTTNRTINFQVNDGAANSNIAAKTVSVTGVNSAPVVTTSGGTTAFVEDGGAVAVDGAITVTDGDTPNLTQATVTITNLLDAGLETLSAPTLLGGATANYVAPTLTISGSTTVANYQTMLAAVTYNNASNTPNITNRVINFQVNDGTDPSNTASKTVSVAATNDAPIVTTTGGNTAFTEDGGAVTIDSGVTVTDADNPNLASATVTITNLLDAGLETLAAPTLLGGVTANYAAPTLTLTGSASLADYQTMLQAVTYNNSSQSPNTTNRVIAFAANDGAVTSTASNKTVTVAGVNDAPAVTTTGATTAFTEDGGAVVVDNGVTVTDVDSPNLASATITITNIQNAGVEVLAAPTLLGGATANYVAPTLTISGSTTVANYQTMLAAVTYNNTSQDPSTTTRVINFQVNDGAGVNNLSNLAAKNVSVAASNDAPTANAVGPFNAQAGMKVTFPAGTLGGTDVEAGTTVTINTTPGTVTNGTVLLNADGSFEFTPAPGSAGGTASFQYNVCDNGNPGPGVCSASPATVTLNVAGPAIYFVTAAGAGTACTVPQPCTLATAVTQIGANTNRRIFIMDNGSHAAAVPLNAQGWLIGQAVTGADFDTVFSINPASVAPGTLSARPAINAAAPTVQQTVSLNANVVVRGLAVTTSAMVAMNDLQAGTFASPTVNETSLSATGAAALDLSTITAASLTFTSISGNGGASSILLNNVAGTLAVNGGTLQATTAAAVSLTNTGSLTTTLTGVTFLNTCVVGISGTTFGSLAVSGVTLASANQAINLTTGAVTGTFTSVSSNGSGNVSPVSLNAVSGNFTVSGGAVADAGAANAVMNITGGAATIVWNGSLTQTNNAPLVNVTTTHTGTITFGGNLSATAGTGLQFSDADGSYHVGGNASALGNTITLNGGDAGIDITTGSSGTFNFWTTTITNPTGTGFNLNGSTATVGYRGNISYATAGQRMIDITSHGTGPVTFSVGTLTATNGTGINLNGVTSAVTFNGIVTMNGGDAGVDIAGSSTGTISFANASSSIGATTSPTGNAFDINNGGVTTNVSYAGTLRSTGASRPVSVQNVGPSSVIGFTNNIASANGNGILLATMGNPTSVTFSGNSKSLNVGANTAVSYTGAAGNTVTFSNGGLVISRTTGSGILASGGGTLIITKDAGISNTIGSGSGTAALSLNNVTIGAGGLVFESIAQNGGTNGITLTNTGATAGLTVAGNGGTCTAATPTCTGGTIQATSGIGIFLSNTLSPKFDRVRVTNTSLHGVRGTLVTNFEWTNGLIQTVGTSNPVDGACIGFNVDMVGATSNVSGVVTITNSACIGSNHHGFDMFSRAGTISTLTITNNTIQPGAASTGDGIRVVAFGDGTSSAHLTKANIDNNIINTLGNGGGVNVQCGNASGSLASGGPATTCGTAITFSGPNGPIQIQSNTISGTAGDHINIEAITTILNGRGTSFWQINSNTLTNIEGTAMTHTTSGLGNTTAEIKNNIIDPDNIAVAGQQGIGVGTSQTWGVTDPPVLKVTMSGNHIGFDSGTNTYAPTVDGNGILAVARNNVGAMNIIVDNNRVASPKGQGRPGIRVDAGNNTAGADVTVCADIKNNISNGTATGSGAAIPGIGVRKEGTVAATHQFGIVGLPNNPANQTQTQNHIASLNGSSFTAVGTGGLAGLRAYVISGDNFVPCTMP
jgi:trimeric autotransporter adhesin